MRKFPLNSYNEKKKPAADIYFLQRGIEECYCSLFVEREELSEILHPFFKIDWDSSDESAVGPHVLEWVVEWVIVDMVVSIFLLGILLVVSLLSFQTRIYLLALFRSGFV